MEGLRLMDNPLISVIMPVYNSEKFLKEAIESVLSETYSNFEFLIYDDMSTDESPLTIQKYADKDKRIRFFRADKKSRKVASVYKYLVGQSVGKYFIASDSDDISLPWRLEILVDGAIKNPTASLIFGKTKLVNSDCSKTLRLVGKPISPYNLFIANSAPDGASLISKEHYMACGGYNEDIEWAEDYDLRLRLLEEGPFVYIDKEVYLYRQHNNSWTSQKKGNKKELIFKEKIFQENIQIIQHLNVNKTQKINYRNYIAIKYLAAYYTTTNNFYRAYRLLNTLDPGESNRARKTTGSFIPLYLWGCSRLGIKRRPKEILKEMDEQTEKSNLIDRTVVTKEILQNRLKQLGVKQGQKIVVHSSLSSFGYVINGADTIVVTLKEIVGEEGLILMPTFTYYTESPRQNYFDIESPCSKEMGIIPEIFRRSPDVHRNFHPFNSFAFWGKNAKNLAEKYCFSDSLSIESPLGEILTDNGYVLMLGTDFSTTSILHTAEYMANVPYAGYKSTFNYLDNGTQKSITLTRTGHSGEFNKIQAFLDSIELTTVKIGNSQCSLIRAQSLVNKAKDLLEKTPDFFLCTEIQCKTCQERRKYLK